MCKDKLKFFIIIQSCCVWNEKNEGRGWTRRWGEVLVAGCCFQGPCRIFFKDFWKLSTKTANHRLKIVFYLLPVRYGWIHSEYTLEFMILDSF